jgi:hypothetical protein
MPFLLLLIIIHEFIEGYYCLAHSLFLMFNLISLDLINNLTAFHILLSKISWNIFFYYKLAMLSKLLIIKIEQSWRESYLLLYHLHFINCGQVIVQIIKILHYITMFLPSLNLINFMVIIIIMLIITIYYFEFIKFNFITIDL